MTEWTDLMVDVETTGTNPGVNGIIQLSAILFNLKEKKVGPCFDVCPSILPLRSWCMDTREFWMVKNRSVFETIVARQEDGQTAFLKFFHWVREHNPTHFWAKPLSFDWPFVASSMEQCGLPMPMHYRYARDMNSYMAGLNGCADHPIVEKEVPFPAGGSQHNALHDCGWQIDQLFYASR